MMLALCASVNVNIGMPAWGAVLADEQIAAVITYLRGAWHNHAGGVSAGQVAAVK